MISRRRAPAILVALLADSLFGEPPNAVHPVVGIGETLALAYGPLDETRSSRRAFLRGCGAVVGVGVAWAGAAAGAESLLLGYERSASADGAPGAGGVLDVGAVAQGLVLSTLLSVRALGARSLEVAARLEANDLEGARAHVGRHLVSRATGELGPALVASAAIESVAENLTDSVIAPLCAFAVAGLPGATFYRVVNTADAMYGYRDDAREALGKAAARLDDVLNWLPGRAAALLLAIAATGTGRPGRALRVAFRDRGRTASPNAGGVMAAMSGALGCRLEKPDAYVLGGELGDAGADDIRRAVRIFAIASVVGGAVSALVTRRAALFATGDAGSR